MRQPLSANARRANIARGVSIRAPVGGWDAVSALADMKEDRAISLDNWFPRPDSVEVRKGAAGWTPQIGTASPVETLLIYNSGTASKMFSASNGKIYDVSNAATASATTVTGKSNNRWQWTNFTTSGGSYLWAVNGTDAPLLYDGSTWSAPAITGATASNFIHVNAFKNRLWTVYKDSTKVAYLNTASIQGTATPLELGGMLIRGGNIVAMATWTRDAGDGEDDIAVFISSEGEVLCFQGTDPTSSNTWGLIGVFHLGAPLGRRCFERVGGDVALINIDGVLPLSKALLTDRAAAANISLTANINNAMNEAARNYQDHFGWQLIGYPKGTMALLNVPVAENSEQHQYVMNTLTGAWCRFKGWNAACFALFNDHLYFGTNDGHVAKADTGGLDLGEPIDANGQQAYNYFGSRGVLKRFDMIRPILTTDTDLRPAVGVSTDFRDNAVIGTPTTATTPSALYDVAIYDRDLYAIEGRVSADWTALLGIGQCASIHFRARSGPEGGVGQWDIGEWDSAQWATVPVGEITLRLNAFDVTFETGGFL